MSRDRLTHHDPLLLDIIADRAERTTAHPATTEPPPLDLPDDLDTTLFNPDQLSYLADFLADHRRTLALHCYKLLVINSYGEPCTPYESGIRLRVCGKLIAADPAEAADSWLALARKLHLNSARIHAALKDIHKCLKTK